MTVRSSSCHFSPLLLLLAVILLISTHSTVIAMRLVLQRVKSASVTVDGNVVSQIGPGVLALVGLHEHDQKKDLEEGCRKLLAAKLWNNDNGGQWRHGVKQRGLEVLLVSQFTLYGKLSKKNQPDYKAAMKSDPARLMYSEFVEMVRQAYEGDKVFDGVFGAMMDVALVNDGPVTLIVETDIEIPPSDADAKATT